MEQEFFEGLEKTNITKVVLDGNLDGDLRRIDVSTQYNVHVYAYENEILNEFGLRSGTWKL